jgi:hypothetical protein
MQLAAEVQSQMVQALWLVVEAACRGVGGLPGGPLLRFAQGHLHDFTAWVLHTLVRSRFHSQPISRWPDVFQGTVSTSADLVHIRGVVDGAAVPAHPNQGATAALEQWQAARDAAGPGPGPGPPFYAQAVRMPTASVLALRYALAVAQGPIVDTLVEAVVGGCGRLCTAVASATPIASPCALELAASVAPHNHPARYLLLGELVRAAQAACPDPGEGPAFLQAFVSEGVMAAAAAAVVARLWDVTGACASQDTEVSMEGLAGALGDMFGACPQAVLGRVLLAPDRSRVSSLAHTFLVAGVHQGWALHATAARALVPGRARDALLAVARAAPGRQALGAPAALVAQPSAAVSQALVARKVVQDAYRLAFTPDLTAGHVRAFLERHRHSHHAGAGVSSAPRVRAVVASALWFLRREHKVEAGSEPPASSSPALEEALPPLLHDGQPLHLAAWAATGPVDGSGDVEGVARMHADWGPCPQGLQAAKRKLQAECAVAGHPMTDGACVQELLLCKPLGRLGTYNPAHRAKLRVLAAVPTMRALDLVHPLPSGEDPVHGPVDVWRAMVLECVLYCRRDLDVFSMAVLALVLAGRVQAWEAQTQSQHAALAACGSGATCAVCLCSVQAVVGCGHSGHGVCGECLARRVLMVTRDALGVVADGDGDGDGDAAARACRELHALASTGSVRCGVGGCTDPVPLRDFLGPCALPHGVLADCRRRHLPRPEAGSVCVPCAACGMPASTPGSAGDGAPPTVVLCAVCGVHTCVACRDAAHPGTLCRSAHTPTVADLLNQAKAQPCPGCRVPTTKLRDCNHMRCVCGVHWCWACGQAVPGRMEDHFRDVRQGAAGAAGDGDAPLPCVMLEYSVHTETARMRRVLVRLAGEAQQAKDAVREAVIQEALHSLDTRYRQTAQDL